MSNKWTAQRRKVGIETAGIKTGALAGTPEWSRESARANERVSIGAECGLDDTPRSNLLLHTPQTRLDFLITSYRIVLSHFVTICAAAVCVTIPVDKFIPLL